MFWRFGFSSTSSLETLLDNPNVSLEEILDEDELLQECKSQNAKLFTYLKQPRVLKRLFEHVVGLAEVGGPGGRDWEEKVRFKYPYICSEVLSSDCWSISDISLSKSDELLGPFWDAILSFDPAQTQPSLPHHMHPFFASTTTEASSPRFNTSNLPTVPGDERQGTDSPQVGVLGLELKNEEDKRVTSARDNGPGKSVLAGYWAKVNGVFLDKNGKGMLDFLKAQPQIVEKFVAHLETPAVVDVLYRVIQCEEHVPEANVIDWLAGEGLIPRVVDLLSPHHSSDLHNTVSELLKAIIALSAPSPANLTQLQGSTDGFGVGGSAGFGGSSSKAGFNNRLVRELASESIVSKMVGFMLDFSMPTKVAQILSQHSDAQTDAAGERFSSEKPTQDATDQEQGEEPENEELSTPGRIPLDPCDTPASEYQSSRASSHLDLTMIAQPAEALLPVKAPEIEMTPESCTSSLVTCIGVLIELIRKNNSDYFEQHLFHTLRTHLLQRQQEIADKRASEKAATEDKDHAAEEDDEMEGMEEAMAEMSSELGIVHLGPMLRILCERLPEFQQRLMRSKDQDETVSTSLGTVAALTFERYRITELYAELLHCSNMALLNRPPGEGPQYDEDGVLQGGIEGLQILARTLQGGDNLSDSGEGVMGNESAMADTSFNEALGTHAPAPAADIGADNEADKSEKKRTSSEGPSETQSHTRDATKHTREAAGPSNGSEDTDDEALLSEVSLSDMLNASKSSTSTEETEGASTGGGEDSEKHLQVAKEHAVEAIKGNASLTTSMSTHADATITAASSPPSPVGTTEELVVGDVLKKQFLESKVIETTLSLFFEYPWNNFLHNVVYDILQQFFNGRMDVGLNRTLTLAVFTDGTLTERIVKGHQRNEESLRGDRRIRMGYMGHMNLIAEETVKLLERYPNDVEMHVKDLLTPAWQEYVSETLKENREKEAAPLAGGRPQGGFVATSGLDSSSNEGSLPPNMQVFANYLHSQMGEASTSDDDDDDEDDQHGSGGADTSSALGWMSRNTRPKQSRYVQGEEQGNGEDGFDDVFQPTSSDSFASRRQVHDGEVGGGEYDDDQEDDDEWGPFADSTEMSYPNQHASSSAQAYLTSADWASEFQRSTTAAEQKRRNPFAAAVDNDADQSDARTGQDEGDEGDDVDEESKRRDSTDSTDSSNSTPFIDLLDSASYRQTDVVAAAHARRPSLGQHEASNAPPSDAEMKRRLSSSSSGSSDPSAANATDSEEPLGPGVSSEARTNEETGMLERVIDGRTVTVPLDDVALASSQQKEAEMEDKGESAILDD